MYFTEQQKVVFWKKFIQCVCHSGHFLCTPVAKTFGEPFCKMNKNDSDSTELGLWSLCMMT